MDVPLSPHMKITIPVHFAIRTILILILLSGIVGSKPLIPKEERQCL
jgi:hypothetical protein